MFGKIGDMGGMLKKAYEMKKEFGKIQEELAEIEVVGVCGSSVEVKASADMTIKSIKIAPETVNSGNVEEVEDMVLVAVNNALGEAKQASQQKMQRLTGGLNIPGLFG